MMNAFYPPDHDEPLDLPSAGRLERAYALHAFECAEAFGDLHPELEAAAVWIAGGCALYAGTGSPLTMAYGLGFDGEVTHDHLDELERFFEFHESPTVIEACTLADPSLMEVVQERGYTIFDLTNVLVRPLADLSGLRRTPFGGEGRRLQFDREPGGEWAECIARGFEHGNDPSDLMVKLYSMYQQCPSTECALALVDGEPAGGGAIARFEEIAILFSASTLPRFRGLGLQKILIEHRLELARDLGCAYATVQTTPESASQRNLEKYGFEVVYAKYKLVSPPP